MIEFVKEIAATALALTLGAALVITLSIMVLWSLVVIGWLSEAILMALGVLG